MLIFFFGLFNITLTTIGQLLLKKSTFIENFFLKNFIMFSGYFSFIVVMIFSYILMKYIDLKYFTIIMSLNYISVLIASSIFFKDKFSKKKIFGTILVMIGIIIFSGDIF